MTWSKLFKRHEKLLDEIEGKISAEEWNGDYVYPLECDRYRFVELTKFDDIKVVILGQDPYHDGSANGLAFSVYRGVRLPPSLKNIFKELTSDIGCDMPEHGDLTKWANQGVLLLNSCLSVRAGQPWSHCDLGWQTFTSDIIRQLTLRDNPPMFVLWGKKAYDTFMSAVEMGNADKVSYYFSAHPSPFSAHKGFFGSKPFSRVNSLLVRKGLDEIDWSL